MTWDYRGLFGTTVPQYPRQLSISEHAKDAMEVLSAAGFDKADVMIGHRHGRRRRGAEGAGRSDGQGAQCMEEEIKTSEGTPLMIGCLSFVCACLQYGHGGGLGNCPAIS